MQELDRRLRKWQESISSILMETGDKAAAIVLEDANLEEAAATCISEVSPVAP